MEMTLINLSALYNLEKITLFHDHKLNREYIIFVFSFTKI